MRAYFVNIVVHDQPQGWRFEGWLSDDDGESELEIKEKVEADNGPGTFFAVDMPELPEPPETDSDCTANGKANPCKHVSFGHCGDRTCPNDIQRCPWTPRT